MFSSYFKAIRHIAYTDPVSVRMSDDNNFVPELYQTLRESENVRLDSSQVRIKEIWDHAVNLNIVIRVWRTY